MQEIKRKRHILEEGGNIRWGIDYFILKYFSEDGRYDWRARQGRKFDWEKEMGIF